MIRSRLMAPPLGRVDRYQLLELVGQGSFGGVYRARHVHTGQIVALKLANAGVDAEAAARILSEGRAAGRLDHPNVVGVLDGGVAETGETFVVMQLLQGETLEQLLARAGPLPTLRLVDVGLQMLDGLAAAHERGVIHRDVKPSNVFVTERDIVKVIDFGISKLRAAGTTTAGAGALAFTLPGVALGTPGYMAPEQLGDARSVDARADVYSVGATLYELASRRKPIAVDGLESWMRRLSSEAAPPLASVAPSVPAAVAAVIDRALARDRDARWPSAALMRDALFRAANGGDTLPVSNVAATVPPFVAPTVNAPSASAPPAPPPAFAAPAHAAPAFAAPAPIVMRPRSAPRRASGGAWVFASIGIVIAVLSIVALGLFVLLRSRL